MNEKFTIDQLLEVMASLRHPELGCEWDKKQTLKKLTSYTLEEVYEVIDAVERQDDAHLQDELGDLLFQVVFYTQITKEEGRFDFGDVVRSIIEKLLRRHPHVFPDGTIASFGSSLKPTISAEQVAVNWELIKNQERSRKALGRSERVSLMDDVPSSLPALDRAGKLQKRAATVGFDWQNIRPVLDKLQEEIRELEVEIDARNHDRMAAELGDILFSCVNLARHLKVEPEAALRDSNRKFERRFRELEEFSAEQSRLLSTLSAEEMNDLWETIKLRESEATK
ncbi:MAG: nucleoside triphosphate pyrophosphohydrolase [Gammaproteobacteria bacterium]|nr:nucleoside triphosphate pyrophosphohydrolase [Gammaproteobacteria bacterium]